MTNFKGRQISYKQHHPEKKHKNEFVETVLESVLFVPMLEGKIIDS